MCIHTTQHYQPLSNHLASMAPSWLQNIPNAFDLLDKLLINVNCKQIIIAFSYFENRVISTFSSVKKHLILISSHSKLIPTFHRMLSFESNFTPLISLKTEFPKTIEHLHSDSSVKIEF